MSHYLVDKNIFWLGADPLPTHCYDYRVEADVTRQPSQHPSKRSSACLLEMYRIVIWMASSLGIASAPSTSTRPPRN